jgi:hypothetical protein
MLAPIDMACHQCRLLAALREVIDEDTIASEDPLSSLALQAVVQLMEKVCERRLASIRG